MFYGLHPRFPRRLAPAAAAAIAMTIALFAGPGATAKADETVQFAPFAVKTFTVNGQPSGSRPVTMFLDVRNKKHADFVCAMAPRVRDAVLGELTRAPLYLTPDGEIPVVQLAERLQPVIAEALEHNILINVGIVDGIVKIASGAAAKLPFAQTGCSRVSR